MLCWFLQIRTFQDLYLTVGMTLRGPAIWRSIATRDITANDAIVSVTNRYPATHAVALGHFTIFCFHRRPWDVSLISKDGAVVYGSADHYDQSKIYFDAMTPGDHALLDKEDLDFHSRLVPLPKHHPTSAELRECPYGHAALKDVPIFYGTPDFRNKAAVSNMDHAIETYQAWHGGCVVSDDSPTVRVTCVTCGFGYESDSELWSRSSPDKASFRIPFSAMLNGFPLPPTDMRVGEVEYSQSVRSNAVTMEIVSYTSREEQPVVFSRATNWLAQFKITTPSREIIGHETLAGTKRNIYEWGHLGPSVMLHQEEDGTSWVMMSNARQ